MDAKRRLGLGILAALIAAGLATAATAQERTNQFGGEESESSDSGGSGGEPSGSIKLIDGSSFDEMIASFERNGLSVELTEDDQGAPQLKSTDKSEPFSVYFYSCTDGEACGFIQFSTGWNMENGITLAKIEEWNSTKVWGQAYRDEDKDPWLSMAINLKGGVTVENFDDTVDWWKFILREFETHIGWEAE
jgi:hypothetical protein